MKLVTSAVLSTLAVLTVAAQAPVPVQMSRDTTSSFENQYVRVFDVSAAG